MKRLLVVLVSVLALTVSGAALAQETPMAGTPEPIAETVFVRQDPAFGAFLTDPAGMTLYLYTKDTVPGESTCNDRCAEAWPPFTADEPLALPGNVEGELTTITRADGSPQVAYNGIPLYYWQQDQQPGDVTGQGVGDVWYVVSPGQQFGAAATPVAAAATGSPATPTAAGEIAVALQEFAVAASTTTLRVGEAYTFTATNAGEFPHEMVIERAGAVDEPLETGGQEAEIEVIEPGASATLEWTFDEPGAYQIACHLGSHYQRGMVVTIQVVV